MQAKVLTVSDGVAQGSRDDKSGRALAERLTGAGYDVVDHRVCADGVESVSAALREMTDGFAGLVVTTGGTGFGPRDLTPEGTRAVIRKASWTRPKIFDWLQQKGNVAEDEMHRVFNCGIGMIVVLSPEQAEAATRVLEAEGEKVYAIGTIEKGPGGEADCVVV